jgi:alkylated DNA repair dioxygenase AlkB
MQTDLFGNINKTHRECSIDSLEKVHGLELHFDFISKLEEIELLKHIDNSIWLHDLTRRVQHYGYKYDYKARKINHSFFLGDLPTWLQILAKKLIDKELIDFVPDQAIVNEYESGQGISPHIDCEPCFGDTIISISLGSTCIMNFEKELNSNNKIEFFVEPRTLLIMKKESRYNYYHGIPQRKSDKFNNDTIKRARRVSITFRKVILN